MVASLNQPPDDPAPKYPHLPYLVPSCVEFIWPDGTRELFEVPEAQDVWEFLMEKAQQFRDAGNTPPECHIRISEYDK